MTIKMNEYTLPSGMAGFNVSDNEYTHPQSKRGISTVLRESLHCNFEQKKLISELEAQIKNLESELKFYKFGVMPKTEKAED